MDLKGILYLSCHHTEYTTPQQAQKYLNKITSSKNPPMHYCTTCGHAKKVRTVA